MVDMRVVPCNIGRCSGLGPRKLKLTLGNGTRDKSCLRVCDDREKLYTDKEPNESVTSPVTGSGLHLLRGGKMHTSSASAIVITIHKYSTLIYRSYSQFV